MKTGKRLYLAALFLIAMVVGCNNDDDGDPIDNSPPTISNVMINDQTDNLLVTPGSDMVFEADFEDNVLLKEYKIDIHDNFDGHSHGRKFADFFHSEVYSLSGASESVHQHIEVPQDATPGGYHFTVQFLDAAGNEGEIFSLAFEIVDPENQPIIDIVSPDVSEEIEIAPGESLTLEGTIEDSDGLEEVHILLATEEDEHNHGKRNQEIIFEQEFLLEGAVSWNFSEVGAIEIPAETEAGHYQLTITAEDMNGYTKVVRAEIHVE